MEDNPLSDNDFKIRKEEIILMNKVKSTKFILCTISILIAVVALVTGYIQPSIFLELMQFTLGSYVIGDSFQKSKLAK